jgi:glutamine---fructose-6-phosphate transaminase (isomerizing)
MKGPPGRTRIGRHGEANVAVVHNGVIENYRAIKDRLESEGYVFRSETDTEVIAHLIDSCLTRAMAAGRSVADDPADTPWVVAVREAIAQLRGTYGLLVLFRDRPDMLVAARLGSPLVVGVGDGEHFIASDSSPLAGHADRIVYLADHEVAVITAGTLRVLHRDTGRIEHAVRPLELSAEDVGMGGYAHFMLKEIHEQPETIRAAMRGRLSRDDATAVFGGLNLTPRQLQRINRIVLTGCGTSWHAALVGEYLIEEFARLPVEVEYASELRYRNPPLDEGTLLFAITQSGETADTLAALREIKRKGHPTLAICNTVGSTIATEADGGIYLHAGPGDRRGEHEGLHEPVRGALAAGPLLRPAAAHELRAGARVHRCAGTAARSGGRGAAGRRGDQADRGAVSGCQHVSLSGPAIQLPGRT